MEDVQVRVAAFKAEVELLVKKYQIDIHAELAFSPNGITPVITFLDYAANKNPDNK